MTSPSTRPGSASTSVTRRCPSACLRRCTTRSTALATVGITNELLMFSPASNGNVHSFTTASRALFACNVHMPGRPLLSASSRSSASADRTSPTMMRSGRMRSASTTSRRSRTSPVPSSEGCRVCIATQSGEGNRSSKTSSHDTTRSRAGTAPTRQPSIVVLPACVPPATRMLRPETTAASRKRAHACVSVPSPTSSSSDDARTRNLRMLTAQCRRVMSGMTTCKRLPSGSSASTKGWLTSSRRPLERSIRSTRSAT